jgi:hypothetical protein
VIALIDADILVYRVGFASNDTSDRLAISRMAEFVEELVMRPDVGDYRGFLTGRNNYRKDIAKTAPYKGNRTGDKPIHFDILREYLQSAWAFVEVEGQEADDAIGIAAYEFDSIDDYLIMTLDKDLDMIRGWHYNFIKDNKYLIEEYEGIVNFYKQILTGDRVDNIVGLKGIGPKKAEKLVKDCKTEQELYDAVLKAYDNDTERVLENGRLLWIRRKPNEMWNPPA